MTDLHIVNDIAYMRRNAGTVKNRLLGDAYLVSGMFQGEMAQDAIENEINTLDNMGEEEFLEATVPNWGSLLKEAAKRKLVLKEENKGV
jgi:hypothetical protein